MFDLNIIIVNYKSKDDVSKLIPSVLTDLSNTDLDFQITVVDNSQNQDGIKEALSTFGDKIKYVDALANVGFGKGNNLGFRAVVTRYHFVLNPDTRIPAGGHTIAKMINFLDANPKIGALGPKLVYPDGTLQYSCYRFDRPSILVKPLRQMNWDKRYSLVRKYANRLEMKDFDHNQIIPVDWLLGAALMLRDTALREVGYFDDRYFMYLEDCDLCNKLWFHGWPVYYFPEAIIAHHYERASSAVPGTIMALVKNRLARAHLASWLKYLWKWRKFQKYYAKLS